LRRALSLARLLRGDCVASRPRPASHYGECVASPPAPGPRCHECSRDLVTPDARMAASRCSRGRALPHDDCGQRRAIASSTGRVFLPPRTAGYDRFAVRARIHSAFHPGK